MAENKRPEDITDVASESGVISSLMLTPSLFYYSEDFLQPLHFSNPENEGIYAGIRNVMRNGGKELDPYGIVEGWKLEPATRKYIDLIPIEAVKEAYEVALGTARKTEQDYKIIVNNVMEAAFRRDMLKQLKSCESLCYEGTEDDIRTEIYRAIDGVTSAYQLREEEPQYKEIVDKKWAEIEERQGSGYAGIPFKFPHLNDYVTIEKGELIIFGAQQKTGKSIMLLNCAVDLLKQGYGVLYIDSELSDRLFTARLLAHLSGVKYRNLTSGNYDIAEKQKILEALDWIKKVDFNHIYMPFFDEQTIFTTVKRQSHVQKLDVIIIDYFKSTGRDTDAFATYAAMGRVVDLVKNEICGSMNIAGIGAAQATANNKLADSAKIARNASTIIMLMDKTMDEIAQDNVDGRECGNKKAVVAFNRNGMQHAEGEYIDLQFDGDNIMYSEAKDQHLITMPY